MRRSNVAGAMNYVPELTWILFLRILDEREAHEADEAEALSLPFTPSAGACVKWAITEKDDDCKSKSKKTPRNRS